MKTKLLILLICLFGLVVAHAQTPAADVSKPPELSEVQKLQLQNVMLRYQLLQAQLQQVQQEAQGLIKGLERPGWTLDVQTMAYTRTPVQPAQGERP